MWIKKRKTRKTKVMNKWRKKMGKREKRKSCRSKTTLLRENRFPMTRTKRKRKEMRSKAVNKWTSRNQERVSSNGETSNKSSVPIRRKLKSNPTQNQRPRRSKKARRKRRLLKKQNNLHSKKKSRLK
jgi:hypothetical protein